MEDKLISGLLQLGFTQSKTDSMYPKLQNYIKELRLFNSAYNLVNTDDYNEIVIRHILDSLSAVNEIKKIAEKITQTKAVSDFVIADIGTGGGLPGIPLAIALSEYNFCLIERMSKRCAFLENVVAILQLNNVCVKNLEAEKVPSQSVDIAVFRAFRPLDSKMTKTLLSLTAPGGSLLAYKARKDKIIEEMNGIKNIVSDYKIVELSVPFLTDIETSTESRERNLVIISPQG